MILSWSGYQIRLPSLISCPGQVPNRPGIEFQASSDFRLHMVFLCRPCKHQSSSAKPPQNLKPRWGDSFFIVVSMSEFGVLINLSYFTHNAKHHQNSQKMALQGAVDALEANLPTSCPAPPYYSISSISQGYMLYESLRNMSRDPAQHRTHASAWEIWIFEGSKIYRRMHFVRIFAFFKILKFLVILAIFQAKI